MGDSLPMHYGYIKILDVEVGNLLVYPYIYKCERYHS